MSQGFMISACWSQISLLAKKAALFAPLLFGVSTEHKSDYRFLAPETRQKLYSLWNVKVNSQGVPLSIEKPVEFRAFDVDGNLLQGMGGVKVREKATGKVVLISNAEFAKYRDGLGSESSPYLPLPGDEAYELYRGTRFRSQVRDMLNRLKDTEWYGTVLNEFEIVMKTRNSPLDYQVALITSRGHPREDIWGGFEEIKNHGFLQNTPLSELIFGVTSPEFEDLSDVSVPDRKFLVIAELLDFIQEIPSLRNHEFGFSDDDAPMAQRVADQILTEKKKGRWPFVDIYVYWSGAGHASKKRVDDSGIVEIR